MCSCAFTHMTAPDCWISLVFRALAPFLDAIHDCEGACRSSSARASRLPEYGRRAPCERHDAPHTLRKLAIALSSVRERHDMPAAVATTDNVVDAAKDCTMPKAPARHFGQAWRCLPGPVLENLGSSKKPYKATEANQARRGSSTLLSRHMGGNGVGYVHQRYCYKISN